MKILLIDDNMENAEIFIRIFHEHNYQDVVHTLTGIEGLLTAQNVPFDIIFIDFDLPDIHGLQIGLALHRQMEQRILSKTPLVALTAQNDRATQDEAIRCGFDAFVGKPVDNKDLIDVLVQLTQLAHQPA